jgi:hypothetical protein
MSTAARTGEGPDPLSRRGEWKAAAAGRGGSWREGRRSEGEGDPVALGGARGPERFFPRALLGLSYPLIRGTYSLTFIEDLQIPKKKVFDTNKRALHVHTY